MGASPKTSDQATADKKFVGRRRDLKDRTDSEYEAAGDDGVPTANAIRNVGGYQRSQEGSERENADDEGLHP